VFVELVLAEGVGVGGVRDKLSRNQAPRFVRAVEDDEEDEEEGLLLLLAASGCGEDIGVWSGLKRTAVCTFAGVLVCCDEMGREGNK